jgi:hypothetical protein
MSSTDSISLGWLNIDPTPINPNQASGRNFADGQLVHAGYLGNDATDGSNGFTFGIQNCEWGVTIMLKAVECV